MATESAAEPTATEEPAVVADEGPNEADKVFAATLIAHNLQAYDLTGLAGTAADDQWVRDFAAAYRAEREPEVQTLKGWLAEWAVEPLDRGQPMPGLISEKDMADLAGSAGAAFDERFTALMIKHQKGALALAKEEKAGRGVWRPGGVDDGQRRGRSGRPWRGLGDGRSQPVAREVNCPWTGDADVRRQARVVSAPWTGGAGRRPARCGDVRSRVSLSLRSV